jgi:hypothetical protein
MSQKGRLNVAGGGGGGSPIMSLTGNSGGPVFPTANNEFIVGTGAVTVTGNPGTSTLTISVAGEGFTWNVVTSATNPNQLAAQNGYISNGGTQVVYVLPLAPAIGDTFEVVSNSATFQITENGAQQIRMGANLSTAGSGNLTSNTVGDCVMITYVGANLFMVTNSQGTLTLN